MAFSDITDTDLEKQVAALSRELSALKRTVARRGSTYYEDGREAAWAAYSDLMERIGDR